MNEVETRELKKTLLYIGSFYWGVSNTTNVVQSDYRLTYRIPILKPLSFTLPHDKLPIVHCPQYEDINLSVKVRFNKWPPMTCYLGYGEQTDTLVYTKMLHTLR